MKKVLLIVFGLMQMSLFAVSNVGELNVRGGIIGGATPTYKEGTLGGEEYKEIKTGQIGLVADVDYLHPVYKYDNFEIKAGGGVEGSMQLGIRTEKKIQNTATTKSNVSETNRSPLFTINPYARVNMEFKVHRLASVYLGAKTGIGYQYHANGHHAIIPAKVILGGKYDQILFELSGGADFVIKDGVYLNGQLTVGYSFR